MFKKLRARLSFAHSDTPAGHHFEKLISGLGALIAIYIIGSVNGLLIPDLGTPLVVASMGASAVLLFAVPHSPLTQPWPLLGGQFLCATIGVTCATYVDSALVAAATAVGLAIFVMYYFRCLHPPGGATALAAVVGGPAVHELGYGYVIAPVMLDACTIMAIGILFNYLFPWRRYPTGLARTKETVETLAHAGEEMHSPIAESDIHYALRKMESFVDVSEQDLKQIYELALHHAESARMKPDQIILGRFYSNGRTGSDWAVRRVIDESGSDIPEKDRIIFRVSAGAGANTTGTCSRSEFAKWAKHEVEMDEGKWIKRP